jgi:hypothetical protein
VVGGRPASSPDLAGRRWAVPVRARGRSPSPYPLPGGRHR